MPTGGIEKFRCEVWILSLNTRELFDPSQPVQTKVNFIAKEHTATTFVCSKPFLHDRVLVSLVE